MGKVTKPTCANESIQIRGLRRSSFTLLDVRLQKDFRLGQKVQLSLFADALNLINADTTQSMLSTLVDSSSFWFPSEPVDPRRVMFGSKLRF